MLTNDELRRRHAQLESSIVRLREQAARIGAKLEELEIERERVALQACGLDIGQSVTLVGTRFKGREAKIVDVGPWRHGLAATPLGTKPAVYVSVPGTRASHLKVSGKLWEPAV